LKKTNYLQNFVSETRKLARHRNLFYRFVSISTVIEFSDFLKELEKILNKFGTKFVPCRFVSIIFDPKQNGLIDVEKMQVIKKTKNKQKKAGDGPFFKKKYFYI